jgi:uncharacterized protein Yka (UPF0111/DUF47 family)
MSWALSRLARDLSGRSQHDLVELLTQQVDAARRGAQFAGRALRVELPASELRDGMITIEHEGDEERGRLVEALSRVLTTPVDREDLFRISRSIDDVLDHIRDFTRELDLYEVSARRTFLPLVDAIAAGLEALEVAVASVMDDPARTTLLCLAAKKSANQVRRMYQDEVAAVFAGPFEMEALKQKELLRRLDVAGLGLGEASDALADGAMKRSR